MHIKDIFIYKVLLDLFNFEINNISVEELLNVHPVFIEQLKTHKLDYYYKLFKNPKKFIYNILIVFSSLELGIYKDRIMTFNENAILLENPLQYKIDVNDNLINEIALYLKLSLKENRPHRLSK